MKPMTEAREARFREVARRRQQNLTVILENVHDPHNIGAVIRSCDAVGIPEIYVLYTEPHLTEERLVMGKKTTAGTRKWVDVHLFHDTDLLLEYIRDRYDLILSAMLSEDATPLWDLDLDRSVALLFGNEKDGVSTELLQRCDGSFYIPMAGMAQSLNISVACAVTLFEAARQRQQMDRYGTGNAAEPADIRTLEEEYLSRHRADHYGRRAIRHENPKER